MLDGFATRRGGKRFAAKVRPEPLDESVQIACPRDFGEQNGGPPLESTEIAVIVSQDKLIKKIEPRPSPPAK
jgi:hypothetical protein